MSIDYNKLSSERFTNTKIYDYDQITAVTQRAINFQMAKMHQISRADSLLKHFKSDILDPAYDDWSQLDTGLGPSSVELLLGTEKQTVRFTLNLTSGTYKYWIGRGRSAKETQTTISNWKLVFKVNMNWGQLEANKVPQHVQDVLKNPNDYTVHQLLVDFTTADVSSYDKDKSVVGLTDIGAQVDFTAFITDYLKKLGDNPEGNHSVIHYLPTIKNPDNYRVPTLAPTSLNFQNLPFVTSIQDQGTGNSQDNMLIYLQTTKNKPLPRDLLAVSSNWVVPPSASATDALYDGTVCMSKLSFLDGWLLPRLRKFNRQSSWLSTLAYWEYGATLFNVTYNVDGHCGLKDNEEPVKGDWVLDTTQTNNTVRTYTYNNFSQSDDNHGAWRVYIEGTTTNKLQIPVGLNADGKCVIRMTGETVVHTSIHIDLGPKGQSYHTGKWTADLVLDGVDKGALQVKTTITVDPPSVNIDEPLLHKGSVSFFSDRINNALKALNMDSIKQDLDMVLGGSWEFIFTGGDDFFIDKAAFNAEGDLLAQLKYKSKL